MSKVGRHYVIDDCAMEVGQTKIESDMRVIYDAIFRELLSETSHGDYHISKGGIMEPLFTNYCCGVRGSFEFSPFSLPSDSSQ